MSAFSMDVRLDAASRQSLEVLGRYPSVLEPQLLFAMGKSVELLRNNASTFADSTFQNSSGQFSGSLQTGVDGPYQAWMGSPEPYARRLEYGFSGMVDSLGRYYELWPGGPRTEYYHGYRWATKTAEDSKADIREIFEVAIDYAHWQLGRGAP